MAVARKISKPNKKTKKLKRLAASLFHEKAVE
jgi:hypothetical protein